MNFDLRTLGPREAQVVLTLEAEKASVVTIERIREIADVAASAAMNLASRLAKKGWLERVTPGKYMLVPAEYGPERTGENNALALASTVLSPSYVGWWAAASFHSFTTQKPFTIHVAATRQAASREILGSDVHFVKVASSKFFGWVERELYGRCVTVSDGPKTVLDCVDRMDLSGGPAEVARIVWGARSVDPELLVDYAERLGSVATAQRLGFLCDIVGRPLEGPPRERLRALIPRSARVIVGRKDAQDGDIGYVREWGVLAHLPKDALLSDVPRVRSFGMRAKKVT